MKKFMILILALVAANAIVFAAHDLSSAKPKPASKAKEPICVTGGRGISECEVKKGKYNGIKVPFTCGVSCTEGTYACCGPDGCHCYPEKPKKK